MVDILMSRDFEIEEKEGYLYGRRDDISIVIMTASDMLIDDVQDFMKKTKGFSGRRVGASLCKSDDSVQSYLQNLGVHYWGREEIEHELGNLQLETVSSMKGRSLIDEIISDDMPQRQAEPHDHSIPVIVESSEEKAERIVKPNFGLDDVKHLARHEIKGYKYELELVPHYLFHFLLNMPDGEQKAGIRSEERRVGKEC